MFKVFEWFVLVLQCDVFVVICFLIQGRIKGEGRSTANYSKAAPHPTPSSFIAGRPKAALLFWFFGDFRCGVPLFIVILVIYKYKNRYNRC